MTDETSDRVLKEMGVFFSNESNKEFSLEGYGLMNKFAQGGFEYIQEELGNSTDRQTGFRCILLT